MTDRIEPTLIPQTCHSCGQVVKLYPRTLYRTMALRLIRLVDACFTEGGDEDGFVHVSALSQPGEPYCDLGKLRLWAPPLAENKLNADATKRCSGMWRPTADGLRFVRGKIRVARYVYMFNQTVYDVSSETISISEALQEDFDYTTMMAKRIMEKMTP